MANVTVKKIYKITKGEFILLTDEVLNILKEVADGTAIVVENTIEDEEV